MLQTWKSRRTEVECLTQDSSQLVFEPECSTRGRLAPSGSVHLQVALPRSLLDQAVTPSFFTILCWVLLDGSTLVPSSGAGGFLGTPGWRKEDGAMCHGGA